MEQQVEEGERDRRWFLHARESPERPFAVVLLHRSVVDDRVVGYHVHAAIFAVVCARPLRETQRERQLDTVVAFASHDAGDVEWFSVSRGCQRECCQSEDNTQASVKAHGK